MPNCCLLGITIIAAALYSSQRKCSARCCPPQSGRVIKMMFTLQPGCCGRLCGSYCETRKRTQTSLRQHFIHFRSLCTIFESVLFIQYELTCVRSLFRILVPLLVSDVFVGHEEQNHLTFLIFNGNNVQKTPELCTCRENKYKQLEHHHFHSWYDTVTELNHFGLNPVLGSPLSPKWLLHCK